MKRFDSGLSDSKTNRSFDNAALFVKDGFPYRDGYLDLSINSHPAYSAYAPSIPEFFSRKRLKLI